MKEHLVDSRETRAFDIVGISLANEQHPDYCEDSYFVDERGACGVFDGVGGNPASEVASRFVADFCQDVLAELPSELSPDYAAHLMKAALVEAGRALREAYQNHPYNIATTAVIAKVFRDPETNNQYVQIAHAGDSRAYVMHDGKIVLTTLDHSYDAFELSVDERRAIQNELADAMYQDEVDPYYWQNLYSRNIVSSCLESRRDQTFEVSTDMAWVRSGDVICLTSDGVHDNLTTTEITQALQEAAAPSETLAKQARERSHEPKTESVSLEGDVYERKKFRPKYDDMTAALIFVL